MQTISINFILSQDWQELGDKHLRYVYELIAGEHTTDEIKTICRLRWSGTKVIGRQDSDASQPGSQISNASEGVGHRHKLTACREK